MARQIASFAGALLILIAYVGTQMKWMDPRTATYNVLNVIGCCHPCLHCLSSIPGWFCGA